MIPSTLLSSCFAHPALTSQIRTDGSSLSYSFIVYLVGHSLDFALALLPPSLSSLLVSVLETRLGRSREVKNVLLAAPLTRNPNEIKSESRVYLYISNRTHLRKTGFLSLRIEFFSWTLLGLEET